MASIKPYHLAQHADDVDILLNLPSKSSALSPFSRTRLPGKEYQAESHGKSSSPPLLSAPNDLVARMQRQTVTLGSKKRAFSVTEDDGSSPRAVYGGDPVCSQHKKGPIPRPESKIQIIPTKDSAKQYYSHLFQGGWRVLNAKDAVREMRKIKAIGQGNRPEKAEESGQAKEAHLELRESMLQPQNPTTASFAATTTTTAAESPAKERKTDYLRLISCIPSDKIWKSWENKHLLCSHANGSSFAQISASKEFSNGLVIRTEAECRARFEVLQEWQPFQDAELLRAGGSGVDKYFVRTCSKKFSKGLVKRSERQCKERYDFLVRNDKGWIRRE